jgi:hypothetical protein
LWQVGQSRPRVINVDGHPAYPAAVAELKRSGALGRNCRCRTSPYLTGRRRRNGAKQCGRNRLPGSRPPDRRHGNGLLRQFAV